jgi:peptidoglycan/LPS O-acetylase OafA/YrhL
MQYGIARLSKLYSVVFPGLVITAMVHWSLTMIDPSLLSEYDRGFTFLRYLLTFGFLNELWFFSGGPPINAPLWSLGYEFWYYIIYGLWFFRSKDNYVSLLIVFIACFIAGPKILLLMPIWIFGAVAYKLPRPHISKIISWSLISFILLLAYFVLFYLPPYPRTTNFPPLFYSGKFLSDYILGVLVSLVIWLLPEIKFTTSFSSSRGLRIFRLVADLTFPLYVFHNPLLIFFKSVINFQLNNYSQMLFVILLVFVICSFVGFYIDRYKKIWDKLFSIILVKFRSLSGIS